MSSSKIVTCGNPSARIARLLERAEFLEASGRHAEASCGYALAIAADSGPFARHSYACHLIRKRQFDAAEDVLLSLRNEAVTTGDQHLERSVCNNLAAVVRELGRPGDAARWQQQALKLSMNLDGAPSAADWSNLGLDELRRGELDFAEQYLSRGLELERDRGTLEGQATDLLNLAQVALMSGNQELAAERLLAALRLFGKLGERRNRGRTLLALADITWKAGRDRSAIRFLQRAVEQFDAGEQDEIAVEARNRLALCTKAATARRRDPLLN